MLDHKFREVIILYNSIKKEERLRRPKNLFNDIGNILVVWLIWSIFYFLFCTLGNTKDLNYERTFYIVLTNLGSIACCYFYVRYLKY